jgi:hypothetical protein
MSRDGPVTEEVKEAIRGERRHGIRSPLPVAPGLKKARDRQEHRSSFLDSLLAQQEASVLPSYSCPAANPMMEE